MNKHSTIINLSIDIHPVSDNGEFSGQIVNKVAHGIKNRIVVINGDSLEDCVNNTKDFLNEINRLSKM